MKKIYVIGGALLVVLLGVYLGLTFFLGSIVRSAVNRFGPGLTQTKVELLEANLSPLSGRGSLRGLSVANPAGWSEANAFRLARVQVDLQPFSIFGDHVVINEITIDGPEFLYETKIFSSNIKDLLKNIEAATGGGPTAEAKSGGAQAGAPVRFIVKKFRLTNGKATLGVGTTALPVPLPTIALDDLGVKEGGITADQLAGVIMKQVLNGIATAAANEVARDGGASVIEKTKDAAKKAGDSLKKLFGKP
jgi:hypothetical protein